MRIYLDTCCLNRPFDDQSQDRVRLEAETVIQILNRFEESNWQWIGSEVLQMEVRRNPNKQHRQRLLEMLQNVDYYHVLRNADISRGYEIQKLGLKAIDALHIACAERSAADLFLTTDQRSSHISL